MRGGGVGRMGGRPRWLAFAFVAGMLVAATPLPACGPEYQDTIFTFAEVPDYPPADFVRGQLGILRRTLGTSYLYAAYRQLAGAGFDDEERRVLLRYWEGGFASQVPAGTEWLARWRDARSLVPGVGAAPQIEIYHGD